VNTYATVLNHKLSESSTAVIAIEDLIATDWAVFPCVWFYSENFWDCFFSRSSVTL